MENGNPKETSFAKRKLQEASRAKRSATLTALAFSTAAVGMVVVIFFALLDYFLMLVPSGARKLTPSLLVPFVVNVKAMRFGSVV